MSPEILSILVYPLAPALLGGHEYLLLRRTPAAGGFWQGVTGTVEPQEALDEAAIRELQEETHLTPIALIPVHYHYTLPSRGGAKTPRPSLTEHVFVAFLEARLDPTIDSSEHDAWAWFSYQDALLWLRWPENIEALKRCEALVNRRS